VETGHDAPATDGETGRAHALDCAFLEPTNSTGAARY